jgi:hypothetical protein
VSRRSRLPYQTSPPDLVRVGLLSFAAGVLLTYTRTRGSRALLFLSKWCMRRFTRTHVLASELLRRRGHPSRDAAELEPHQAVYLRTAVLVRELRLTGARSCMSSTKLSPLLSLLESGEDAHACEPNLTVAQPVVTGTPSSRASFLPRRASADQLVYAFALRHASAYNLIDVDHPSLVAETFCFAPHAKLLSVTVLPSFRPRQPFSLPR